MANQHLERAGVEARIDMRSHAERKTGLEPEAKQLPSQWRGAGRENVIEFRAARVEQRKAAGLLREEIPNISAEIINIEDARKLRDQAKAMAADGVAAFRQEFLAHQAAQAAIAAEQQRQLAEQERQREQVRKAEAAKSRLDGLSNQGRSAKPKGYDGPGFG